MNKVPPGMFVGRRVVVTGIAGSGKSTFSRALSEKTGLPIVVLDVHYWMAGWAKPTEAEWREKQPGLLAGEDWIADGNYHGRGSGHSVVDMRIARARARDPGAPGRLRA